MSEEKEEIKSQEENEDLESPFEIDYTDKLYNLSAAFNVLLDMDEKIDEKLLDKETQRKLKSMKSILINIMHHYCKKLNQSIECK